MGGASCLTAGRLPLFFMKLEKIPIIRSILAQIWRLKERLAKLEEIVLAHYKDK